MDGYVDKIVTMKNYTIKNIDKWKTSSSKNLNFDHFNEVTTLDFNNLISENSASLKVNKTVTVKLHSFGLFKQIF